MAENTKIEWADHTFNPWTGCTKVSPGCDRCFAEAWSKRAGDRVGKWGPGAQRVRTTPANWKQPIKWNAEAERLGVAQSVFCASLGDWADNAVPAQWRFDLADLIIRTPWLNWLLLTKRIGNAAAMLAEMFPNGMPRNVRIGATICNQPEADRDIPKLLALNCPNFLSIEPMLGPVDLTPAYLPCPTSARHGGPAMDPDTGAYECCKECDYTGIGNEIGIDWVIVGGESGPGARPMHPDWVRSLRDQCQAAGVPFLFKQWGEWAPVAESPVHPESTRIPGNLCRVTRDGVTTDHYVAISTDGGRQRYELKHIGKKAAGRLLDGREWNKVPV